MKIATVVQFLQYGPTRSAFREYFRRWKPILSNLISSDVYTMASAISTCAVLSFFPFTILLISIVRNVFRLESATDAIRVMLEVYLPYIKDMPVEIARAIARQGSARLELASALILIVSAIGVFIPIEVTLNRIWEAPTNMSFIKNQLISFGVIFICGLLSLFSFVVGGFSLWLIRQTLGQLSSPTLDLFAEHLSVRIMGFLLSSALFFVIFSLLPNIRMKLDTTLRASLFTGVAWDLFKHAYLWLLERLDLGAIYGKYFTSAVVLILWAYVSAMIMILGAELAHRDMLSLRLFRPAYDEWKRLHSDRNSQD